MTLASPADGPDSVAAEDALSRSPRVSARPALAGQHFARASGETAAFVIGGVPRMQARSKHLDDDLVLLALAVPVRVESRAAEPIIPPSVLRNRTVTLTIIADVLVGVAMFPARCSCRSTSRLRWVSPRRWRA